LQKKYKHELETGLLTSLLHWLICKLSHGDALAEWYIYPLWQQ